MNTRSLVPIFGVFFTIIFTISCKQTNKQVTHIKKPNVILILADDLGYGDIAIHQNNPKISTPVLDSLVNAGISFTNAHSSSAVCTPSRYSILTGEYSWRSKLKSGVLFGFDQPLIKDKQFTIAKLFKNQGYKTASIGKWHLGLPWQVRTKSDYFERTKDSIVYELLAKPEDVVLTAPFVDGEWYQKIGFDYFYGISASLDIPPYGMIENDRFTLPLDSYKEGSTHQKIYHVDYWREGVSTKDFDPSKVLIDLIDKTESFISDNKENPFFIYLPITAPHTPWLPAEQFKGKSQAGKYGDFLAMVDWSVGQVTASLKANGLTENTIIIFSSDNGAPLKAIQEYGGNGHTANADFRGQKGDLYEGGHHVPLIMTWKNHIKAGRKSDALVMLNDILATMSDITSSDIPNKGAVDSYSFYGALQGDNDFQPRQEAIYHSQIGTFAIQSGDWKLIEQLGSGGFSKPREKTASEGEPYKQLYNLKDDPIETDNKFFETNSKAKELQKKLDLLKGEMQYQ